MINDFHIGDFVSFRNDENNQCLRKYHQSRYPIINTVGVVVDVDDWDIAVDWGTNSGTLSPYTWWVSPSCVDKEKRRYDY